MRKYFDSARAFYIGLGVFVSVLLFKQFITSTEWTLLIGLMLILAKLKALTPQTNKRDEDIYQALGGLYSLCAEHKEVLGALAAKVPPQEIMKAKEEAFNAQVNAMAGALANIQEGLTLIIKEAGFGRKKQ